MKKVLKSVFVIIITSVVLTSLRGFSHGRDQTTPLQFLKKQELKNREMKGEVYLGIVMTLTYPVNSEMTSDEYHPFLLELTDVLKTPLRKGYRLVLKGFSDSLGSADYNLRLSGRRAEKLKALLMKKYYMSGDRISFEGHGADNPLASNATAEGRRLNRRVEIHVYGDVSQAVRFIELEEVTK